MADVTVRTGRDELVTPVQADASDPISTERSLCPDTYAQAYHHRDAANQTQGLQVIELVVFHREDAQDDQCERDCSDQVEARRLSSWYVSRA